MKHEDLYQLLTLHPDKIEARRVAMQFLEETATDDHGFVHIVDPVTLNWQQEFSMNGNDYYILSPKTGSSLRRYQLLKAAMSVINTGMSINDQMKMYEEGVRLVNTLTTKKPAIFELSLLFNNVKETAVRFKEDWDMIAWAATYYILRKDEDPTTYNEVIAKEKMNDWNIGRLDIGDLFFCNLLWQHKWNERLNAFAVRLT